MSTSLKSSLNDIFHRTRLRAQKNGFCISFISHDLGWAYTWATPQNSLLTGRCS
jgi:hypothetical protein